MLAKLMVAIKQLNLEGYGPMEGGMEMKSVMLLSKLFLVG